MEQLVTVLIGLAVAALTIIGLWVRNELPKLLKSASDSAAEKTKITLEMQRVELEERRDDIAQRTINKDMLMRLMVQTNQQEEKIDALNTTTTTLQEQARATEQRLNDQIADLQRQLREANTRAAKLQSDVTSLEARLKTSETERAQLRQQLDEKTAELERHQQMIADLQKQVAAVESSTNGTGPLSPVTEEK
jgi:chromosome segregation ATPase